MVHIFVDFEMNQIAWKDRKKSGQLKNEIIQIGAVKLNDQYQVLDTYEAFVKPIYSELCGICMRLTGIRPADVENAPVLPQAIALFEQWVGTGDAQYYSWSDNDSKQLLNELKCKGAGELAPHYANWVDFQAVYCKLVGQDRMALDLALSGAGLFHIGSRHSAMSDALSSVQLLKLIHSESLFEPSKKQRIVLHTKKIRDEQQEKRRKAAAARAARAEKKAKEAQNPVAVQV